MCVCVYVCVCVCVRRYTFIECFFLDRYLHPVPIPLLCAYIKTLHLFPGWISHSFYHKKPFTFLTCINEI